MRPTDLLAGGCALFASSTVCGWRASASFEHPLSTVSTDPRMCGGDELAGKRASVLHNWMGLIDMYTMSRALKDLTQAEFDWEPHPGAWGVRRRDACTTPNPSGDATSAWVADQDWGVQTAAFGLLNPDGKMNEPMTTIGWLLNHFGAAPALTSQLDFVGGPTVPTGDVYRRMWAYTIIATVDEAVARF